MDWFKVTGPWFSLASLGKVVSSKKSPGCLLVGENGCKSTLMCTQKTHKQFSLLSTLLLEAAASALTNLWKASPQSSVHGGRGWGKNPGEPVSCSPSVQNQVRQNLTESADGKFLKHMLWSSLGFPYTFCATKGTEQNYSSLAPVSWRFFLQTSFSL